MSCCDGSTLEIINLSGQTITLTSVDHTQGSTHHLSDNDSIAYKSFELGWAYSGSGTDGNAKGTINITVGSSTTMALDYEFTQDSGTCTPTSQDAVTEGNYVATPSFHTSDNSGEAYCVWTVTSQPS
jgi:hypothetical protein